MNREQVLKQIEKGDLDFRRADLSVANLSGADLRGADLRGANLQRADLADADLADADLDFSCWPLWCGSLSAKIDASQARQLAYHLAAVLPGDCKQGAKWLFDFANEWEGIERHRLETLIVKEDER